MNKITLEQLKEQQQISSLDEYENMDLHHTECNFVAYNSITGLLVIEVRKSLNV